MLSGSFWSQLEFANRVTTALSGTTPGSPATSNLRAISRGSVDEDGLMTQATVALNNGLYG